MERPFDRVARIASLGRDRVVAELERAGVEVERLPRVNDRVHLVARATLEASPVRRVERPLHVQASATSSFRVLRTWAAIPDLLLVYTWHVTEVLEAVSYALTYAEAEAIAEQMGWTTTWAWRQRGGGYGTTKAEQNRRLRDLLAPHRMTPQTWWGKVTRLVGD